MLTPDVRVEGFDAREWDRLGEVFRSPRLPLGGMAKGGVVVVSSDGRLRKVVSTVSGRIDPETQPWPEPLAEVAARHHARWAAELTFGALDELAERFADRVERAHDFLTQSLSFLTVMRELESEGALRVWPLPLAEWPVPRENVVLAVLDALCPKGKALALVVFEQEELSTCLVARRGERGFDALVGPSELRPEVGFLSGDFRRDYRYVARAIEEHVAPLSLACYGEFHTFRRLAASETPGSWATAVAARDIVLSPAPPVIALPLGVDVGRAAFAGLRVLADRAGMSGLFGGLGAKLGRIEGLAMVEQSVSEWLGFDPIKLLSRLLAR